VRYIRADGYERILAVTRQLVDPALRAAVATLSEPTRTICGHHFGWCDPAGRPGKALRPAMTIACAKAVGATADAAVPAATAVELLHNFTLIHDDIIDGDHTRRNRRTVWSAFGIPAAILAGDALFALAVEVLAAHPRPRTATALLGRGLVEVINGQTADLVLEHRDRASLAESMDMAARKTGALLGCACALGALSGGAGSDQVTCLRRFGEQLGMAFQLVDDVLGIWGDPETTGKPARSDVVNRKKSLPVVAALDSGTAAGAELGALYRLDRPLTSTEVGHAVRLVEQAGGRLWARQRTDRCLAEALALVRGADIAPAAAGELSALAHLVVQRDH